MRKKKNRWKNLVLGMVLMALLMALALPALATTGKKTIEVDYMDIHLHVDGIPVPLSSKPFVCEGTTYLPVRAVGEALGKDVRWDGLTHTIYITDPAEPNAKGSSGSSYGSNGKKTIEVDYLDIKLVVDGKEITPKDANGKVVEPFAYNGTSYLPVRAVGEALGKTVRWDGETKTVYLGELPQGTYLVDVCKVVVANSVGRAADHKSFDFAGKRYSQYINVIRGLAAVDLGGKYESLTFDFINTGTINASNYNLSIYLDGELAQTIKEIKSGGVQTVTVPLNYAQTIAFHSYNHVYIANAVLNGERAVPEKPVPPENATYLADVYTDKGKTYKAAEEQYIKDIFGNQYTNGVYHFDGGEVPGKVPLNGGYKTLKATIVKTDNYDGYLNKKVYAFYVDGEVVKEIELSCLMGPKTIEIPLNYGLELKIPSSIFLADAILE